MARSRNIKPGFFTNDVLCELPPLARLLFAGLWTYCDREGRCEDRPKKIKQQLLGYDDCDCDALLNDLHRTGFIERYTVGSLNLIRIVEWNKHQNPHVKEAASELPAPVEHQTSPVQEQGSTQPEPERAGLDSSPLIPDSLEKEGADAPPPQKAKPPKFDAKTVDLPEWLDSDLWGQWVDERKARGKPITENGATKQLAQLADYRASGHSPKAVIDHAIGSGNQGLYPPPRIGNAGPSPPKSFRERDHEAAASRMSELSSGRVAARPHRPFDAIDMETANALAIGND